MVEPFPRLSAATFAVNFPPLTPSPTDVRWPPAPAVAATAAVTATAMRLRHAARRRLPRDGAYLLVLEWALPLRHSIANPSHTTHFRIGPSAITAGDCGPSDTVLFREGGRGYQVQIYLGPAAPASARAQIAGSWRVTSARLGVCHLVGPMRAYFVGTGC